MGLNPICEISLWESSGCSPGPLRTVLQNGWQQLLSLQEERKPDNGGRGLHKIKSAASDEPIKDLGCTERDVGGLEGCKTPMPWAQGTELGMRTSSLCPRAFEPRMVQCSGISTMGSEITANIVPRPEFFF